MVPWFFLLLAVLVPSLFSSQEQADRSSCSVDMDMRVTINVTDARPREVFDQLSDELNCKITVYPFFMRKVTVQMENARLSDVIVAIIQQLHAKYIHNGGRLSIMPLTIFDKMQANYWEDRNTRLESRLPEGMSFEEVPLSTVLEEISKASGLDIKPWEGEGDREVTVDVSGMTVNDALKAVVLYVDGEGAVLIKMGGFNTTYGQHWLWGYPPPP